MSMRLFLCSLMAFGFSLQSEGEEAPRFLALGDSYTIGEAVEATQRWPAALVRRLATAGVVVGEPDYLATTGWTTRDLLNAIAARHPAGPYALVTVQIGVNDQYGGGGVEAYRGDLNAVLARAIALAGNHPDHVLVLSIPDWGVTPFAHGRDASAIALAIDDFNAVNREAAKRVGAGYIDVTPSSRVAAHDRELLAIDGLHPSASMYARWAELAAPAATSILSSGR